MFTYINKIKKNVVIISRTWYPNHQLLFEEIQAQLPENVDIYYCLLSANEKGRTWEIRKNTIDPKIIPGLQFKMFSKEIMINLKISEFLSTLKPALLIITPWSEIGCYIAKNYAQKNNIPVIGWIVGLRDWSPNIVWNIRRWMTSLLFRMFINGQLLLFADGSKARDDAIKHGEDKNKIVIVKHVIDEEHFDYLNTIKNYGNNKTLQVFQKEKKYVFLCISQLLERKGINHLIESFNVFSNDYNDANLLLVGDGPLRKKVKNACAKNKNIYWIQSVPYNDIPLYYSIADCVIVPSLFDDWCNVVNESHCEKIPIICSTGALASYDLIKHGETGLLYNYGDIDALVEAMKYAKNNPEKMKKMAEKGFNFIKSNWNTKISARIWVDNIKKVINCNEK